MYLISNKSVWVIRVQNGTRYDIISYDKDDDNYIINSIFVKNNKLVDYDAVPSYTFQDIKSAKKHFEKRGG